jgi:Na+/glutamate symporter
MLIDIFTGHALFGEYVFMILCGAAAWMIGKSISTDWSGLVPLFVYVLLLGVGVRFLHYALYEAEFISVSRYVVDTAVLAVIAYIGYRFTRTNQMTTQYHWLYEKVSPLSFRERG